MPWESALVRSSSRTHHGPCWLIFQAANALCGMAAVQDQAESAGPGRSGNMSAVPVGATGRAGLTSGGMLHRFRPQGF